MRSLFFFLLAGCAVRCDDTSYYVIEMPEDTQREFTKPFRVYWNVPSMQCKSKKVPFDHLFQKYGIMQNTDDRFIGEKVAILYDPGLFPALLKNETSGDFKFRNGGVPQEGDLEKHIAAFKATLDQSIPDENFSGIGIIDFESWRPVLRQNFGVLVPYKDVSYRIERSLHWFWTEKAIQMRARQRFEESARAFMQTTVSLAKQMRPRALWGYYGYPYCFNMANNNMAAGCADKVPQENNKIYWLWAESSALYPSVYSSKSLKSNQLAGLIRGRVAEASRTRRKGTPILPYFWFRYRDGGFMSQTDLNVALDTLYKSDASGFIVWGSSNDVNTYEKCSKLLKYTTEVLGPAIAKYTKTFSIRNSTDSETTKNPVSNPTGLTTWRPVLKDDTNNSEKPFLDPEYHWDPPENYTQNIEHHVEQELKKKPGYHVNNTIVNDTNSNSSDSIGAFLNLFRKYVELVKNETTVRNEVVDVNDEDKTSQITSSTSTRKPYEYSIEQSIFSLTKNPVDAKDTSSPEYTSSGKFNSDTFESSTMKLNTLIAITTSSYYLTNRFDNADDRDTNIWTSSVINSQEVVSTEKPSIDEIKPNNRKNVTYEELEQLADLLDLESNFTDTSETKLYTNINATHELEKFAELPFLDSNYTDTPVTKPDTGKNVTNEEIEQLTELLDIENNFTDTSTTISDTDKYVTNEQEGALTELLPLGSNFIANTDKAIKSYQFTGQPTFFTLYDAESVTETISSTEVSQVTSTSHKSSAVPLYNKLDEVLSTISYKELVDNSENHTTDDFNESISTPIPDITSESFSFGIEDISSESEDKEQLYTTNIDATQFDKSKSINLELTTESFKHLHSAIASGNELRQEIISDENLILELDKIPSMENITNSAVEVNDETGSTTYEPHTIENETNYALGQDENDTTTELPNSTQDIKKNAFKHETTTNDPPTFENITSKLRLDNENAITENYSEERTLDRDTKSSTTEELNESYESSTLRVTKSVVLDSENVPDSVEDSIEGTTSDATSTTEDIQVVVFL